MSSSDSGSLLINENFSQNAPVLRSVFDPNPVAAADAGGPLAVTPGSTPATLTEQKTVSEPDDILPAETQDVVQKLLLAVGIGQLFVAAAGIALLSVLGYTIAGGILIGAACFLAIATLVTYSLFRYARKQSVKKKLLDEFSLSKTFEVIRSLLLAIAVTMILAVASTIQGAVLLGNAGTMNVPFLPFIDPFVYQRTVTYMFIWLGSGSLALGVLGILVEAVFLHRLYRLFRELRDLSPGDGFFSIERPLPRRRSSAVSEENNGKMIIAPNGTYSTYVRYIDVPANGSPEPVRHGSATDV
ncbi:uncharacterized protein LOC129588401 isoform X2 [Paramacrobiotus metropolitanus]|nr:uncharacterized protein LOC129588401 isoform X2 [Paramacrobiotus metropolitanus]